MSSRVVLPVTSPYTAKDQRKSDRATKFIGRGSDRSSTATYARAWGALANCGHYLSSDRVFVSVEGNRSGRKGLDLEELSKALAVGAVIIADDEFSRSRPYNIGERELANLLKANSYAERSAGEWHPPAGD